MTLLITEVAFNADGEFAIEVTNTGSSIETIVGNPSAEGQFALNVRTPSTNSNALSLTDSFTVNPGETVTIGHSNIAGVDFNADDTALSRDNVVLIDLLETASIAGGLFFLPETVDTLGSVGGPVLSDDSTYTSDTSRTPDADVLNNNLSDFTQTSPFSTNTLGSPTLSCFLAGTAIATADGTRAVETLAPGDLVLTADGRAVPVVWLGEQTVKRRIGILPETLRPVRIRAGALGDGLPHRDLRLTADHALLLDGCLINAGALINGNTIVADPAPRRFTVYHIETDAHEVLLAEGAPTESFIDYTGRDAFDNYDAYLARFGRGVVIPEMNCPRISTARFVPPTIRKRLNTIAEARIDQLAS